jgi:hypothetical protein
MSERLKNGAVARDSADVTLECQIEDQIYRNATSDGAWATAYALIQVCKRLKEVEEAILGASRSLRE